MRVAVIGAGLAGLSAALMAAQRGHRVTLLSKGIGALPLSHGSIDVLGYRDSGTGLSEAVKGSPFAALAQLPSSHPYQQIGEAHVRAGVQWLRSALPEIYPPTGSASPGSTFPSVSASPSSASRAAADPHSKQSTKDAQSNIWLPTALGSIRPTYSTPRSCQSAALHDGMRFLVVGIAQYQDFPAALIAQNLMRQPRFDLDARAITVSLPLRAAHADVKGTDIARAFDSRELDPEAAAQLRARFADAINKQLRPGETVLIPAVMGVHPETFEDFSSRLCAPVAEVATVPPSILGLRVYHALHEQCKAARIDIRMNCSVIAGDSDSASPRSVRSLRLQRAGGTELIHVDRVIDAAGGFASGNLTRDSQLAFRESIFDLPLSFPTPSHSTPELGASAAHSTPAVQGDASGTPHPPASASHIALSGGLHEIDARNRAQVDAVLSGGVRVDRAMRPISPSGDLLYANLFCIGDMLAGAAPWREYSGEGLALGSAHAAVSALENTERQRV